MIVKVVRVLAIVSIILVAVGCAIRMPVYTKYSEPAASVEINTGALEEYVRVLSEDMIPRTCEQPELLENTAVYLQNEFSKWNSDTYTQDYEVGSASFSNIIAEYGPNTDSVTVVGAHYDAFLDLPGADDNASGVAGLLEIARLLSNAKLKSRVILIAYACEEPPFYNSPGMGSHVHANSIVGKDVTLMISLEMIGYFTDEKDSQQFPMRGLSLLYPNEGNFVAVVGNLFSTHAARLKHTINRTTEIDAYSINAPSFVPGIDFSDHRNYWAANYPAVMVTDTAFFRNEAYHTANDTYNRLDYEKMGEVITGVYLHILDLANKN